ncbi:glycogen debranching protein GlgX [Zhihengliuella salsuginis]|uniref:Glycogen operon protein GlgX homolog n=1 Tax=Zhihengliuella salsuginis TaxID=578222 RepID=A0ABQ3GNR2_9MICC|nr:glycogen debranching protein GlgX [Zhihengliuella salsuginis]GHD12826.1 glycogen operon protein GlgX homolog [Zhihengliuella salsuginis]
MAQPSADVPVSPSPAGSGPERFSRSFPRGVAASVPGLSPVADAVNVAVFAPELDGVDVWFTDPDGSLMRTSLPDTTDGVFHGRVEGLRPGARYAFWEHGAELPENGQLLVDPYARAVEEYEDGSFWGVFVEEHGFDWGSVARPHVPWRDTVVYEAHVKGQTKLHPDIPEELRGTYAGFAHPAMIEHLASLGVTTVELLPIHFHIDEPHLQDMGLPNYWGYNTLGFFAPHQAYATAAAQAAGPAAVRDELKGMVKLLHAAGIEVVLDVVFNHTAEGGQGQQALSWRGLADRHYYRHTEDGAYFDTTGVGNTLDFNEPAVIRMAMDSLRYWVEEFHIDGFRFDLAVSLGRDAANHFTASHPFFTAIAASEALTGVKMIAEPWDVSMGGWQTGSFPRGFADWNDKFRDTVREFWVADHGRLAAGDHGASVARLAGALAGSRDLFSKSGRGALASVNLVTAHDGFTLRDLVSYDRKHNEDNGEENRDGHSHNNSFNHGVEGQTGDQDVNAERLKTASNVMATLALSLGVPMITAGDEMGKTQEGNNNAYCQDNPMSWLHWNLTEHQRQMLQTTRDLFRIRKEFLANQPYSYPAREDSGFLFWFNGNGDPLQQDEWTNPGTRLMQLLIGSPGSDMDGLVVFNGTLEDQEVALPHGEALAEFSGRPEDRARFELRYSTDPGDLGHQGVIRRAGEAHTVTANSISIFRA